MNVRGISMCLLCAGALFVACGSKSGKKVEVTEQADTVHVLGSDKDKHSCIASAGYTWSEVRKDCIRLWEKGVRMNAVDDAGKTLFLVFSPDSAQVELFFSEEGVSNEILDRRGLPAGGYAWNVEDDDTKNVRLEDGKWTVTQRGKLIYQEDAAAK
ncbi:hypothetical protein [uncultured Bacteroides sp.]|uniref:hypothetical protein n=1 Tax=uncultured Bacteroides sp. TaxID=162156 RepID=UPI002595DDC8|nr:hypothetical protein [uncultured Bacteroides sp.]